MEFRKGVQMNPSTQKMLRAMLGGVTLVIVGFWLGQGRVESDPWRTFSETVVHASTASTGNHFALATGLIEEDAEGVFVLDYESGVLKCAVLNHRTGKFAAMFETNVTKELGTAKNAKYQMVTGRVNFNRMSAAGPGMSVVYVLNAANGEMAAYGIPWQREASATGRPQVGTLKAIDGMRVRR